MENYTCKWTLSPLPQWGAFGYRYVIYILSYAVSVFKFMFYSANLVLQYSVILFPFDVTPGLDLGNAVTLLEQPVDIVTAFAPGPRARMNVPPRYESEIPA